MVERGGFPRTHEEILALPGVGEYTAAAVASIAFGLPHAVLDGNVMRVMARLTADFGDIAANATKTRLRDAAQRCLVSGEAGDTNQAFMELGATLCLPRDPCCLLCPVSAFCKARAEGVQGQLPTKLRRPETVAVETTLLRVERQAHLLLWQRPATDRMAGFWELPDHEMLPFAELREEQHRFRHSIMNRAYRCTVYAATLDDNAAASCPPATIGSLRTVLPGCPSAPWPVKRCGISQARSCLVWCYRRATASAFQAVTRTPGCPPLSLHSTCISISRLSPGASQI